MKEQIHTSTCGTVIPVLVDTSLTKRLNLGSRALAAGPPSYPNSLALHHQSNSAIRTLQASGQRYDNSTITAAGPHALWPIRYVCSAMHLYMLLPRGGCKARSSCSTRLGSGSAQRSDKPSLSLPAKLKSSTRQLSEARRAQWNKNMTCTLLKIVTIHNYNQQLSINRSIT